MARIRTYSDYVDYFKEIARTLKALNPEEHEGNFYEFQGTFKGNNLKLPALVLVPPTSSMIDAKSDNEMEEYTCELWILASVKTEDNALRNEKLDLCEGILKQIIAKIKADHLNFSTDRPIVQIDFNSFRWEQLGPLGEANLYGYQLEFEFQNPNRFALDSTQWWN